MNEPAQATPDAAPAAQSVDDRFSALAQSLTPVGEDSDFAQDAPAKSAPKADTEEPGDAAPATDKEEPVDPERAARLARRAELRAKAAERNEYVESRRRQTQQAQAQAPSQELAQLQAEVQRLKVIEESIKDPQRFFEAAMGVGVDPSSLTSWLEKAVNDPTAMVSETAVKRAKEAVSPEIAALKQELDAVKEFHAQQVAQAKAASERAAEAELIAHASKLGEDSATNQWREAFGDSQIIALANSCLSELPKGSTMLDLLDLVEERCEFAIQRLTKRTTKQPRKPEQPAQKNISARVRADRTEIEDPEAAMASLSVDERFRLLATQLNNSR